MVEERQHLEEAAETTCSPYHGSLDACPQVAVERIHHAAAVVAEVVGYNLEEEEQSPFLVAAEGGVQSHPQVVEEAEIALVVEEGSRPWSLLYPCFPNRYAC